MCHGTHISGGLSLPELIILKRAVKIDEGFEDPIGHTTAEDTQSRKISRYSQHCILNIRVLCYYINSFICNKEKNTTNNHSARTWSSNGPPRYNDATMSDTYMGSHNSPGNWQQTDAARIQKIMLCGRELFFVWHERAFCACVCVVAGFVVYIPYTSFLIRMQVRVSVCVCVCMSKNTCLCCAHANRHTRPHWQGTNRYALEIISVRHCALHFTSHVSYIRNYVIIFEWSVCASVCVCVWCAVERVYVNQARVLTSSPPSWRAWTTATTTPYATTNPSPHKTRRARAHM